MKVVQILGLFNSGTNLLYKIVDSLFDVKIGDEGHTLFWKHSVIGKDFAKRHIKGGDKYIYLVVSKNPYFQFHSFKKAPYSIRLRNTTLSTNIDNFVKKSFYVLPPRKAIADTYSLSFKNCPHYWNSFFESTFKYIPTKNVEYIKYEDVIFDTQSIVNRLKLILPLKKEFMNDTILLNTTLMNILKTPAKKSGKPRFGKEATQYYNDSTIKDLYKEDTFKWMNTQLSKKLMEKLGYSLH